MCNQKEAGWLNDKVKNKFIMILVGGFNPSEKYESNWKSSPGRGENKKYLSCHHLGYILIQMIRVSCRDFDRPILGVPMENQ